MGAPRPNGDPTPLDVAVVSVNTHVTPGQGDRNPDAPQPRGTTPGRPRSTAPSPPSQGTRCAGRGTPLEELCGRFRRVWSPRAWCSHWRPAARAPTAPATAPPRG